MISAELHGFLATVAVMSLGFAVAILWDVIRGGDQ